MDFRAKQIVPPRSWADFENLCLAIFRAEWNSPLALKNGRTGQPQHGVDIYGSPQPNLLFGIQCKGKDRNYGSKATVGELREELTKAEKFSPRLSHWIFVTSASKDEKIQRVARNLTAERKAKGQFPITALGWEDIQSLLARHPNVIEDFYPEHAFDIPGILRALRALPSGDEVRELCDQLKRLNEAQGAMPAKQVSTQWELVTFEGKRDLGPALLGRGLGPADASACPRLQEADLIVAQLRRAFFARLVGAPGSGKSVCAYQAAGDFAAAGWIVRRIRDASAIETSIGMPPDELSLLLLDDAHLMAQAALRQIEETANARRLVLSIHNGVEDGPVNRGSIVIDAKRAVRTIATELLANPEQTLAAVRRADDDVGVDFFKTSLEQRINDAVVHSDRPWQFCFVLGGGWKRSQEASTAARVAGADLVLAATGIIQLASRDAQLAPASLCEFCNQNGIAPGNTSRAISWLASQRLLLSDADCRCPHQRFAIAVLGRILEGQDDNGRAVIGRMLTAVVRNPCFPIAGLRMLLNELRFLDEYKRWTRLVETEALEQLIFRCWSAASSDDRTFAALLFSELDTYVDGWLNRFRDNHILTIAAWITAAAPPAAYGLSYLLNALRNQQAETASAISRAVNPEAIAHILSNVTPESADHCASLIKTIGWQPHVSWKAAFSRAFTSDAVVTLAKTWPNSSSLYYLAHFCAAISAWDDKLALAMVDAFLPIGKRALVDNPVQGFRALEDILHSVLRLSDPLNVYIGKLAPDRKRFALGRALCAGLKPKVVAVQLSETLLRDFQDATLFLAFLKKASISKFRATIDAIDWLQIGRAIGPNWANLPHEVEIFLTIVYSSQRARKSVSDMVSLNLDRIDQFSPRLAAMMPEVAVCHIEAGKPVRLGQHEHFSFNYSAFLIAQLVHIRPDLIDKLLEPFETFAAMALSRQDASWFREAAIFVGVLRDAAPGNLQKILSSIDATKAEAGWTDSLQKGGGARQAVALLIEAALSHDSPVGELARRLRKKYRRRSVPREKWYSLRGR